MCDHPSLPPLFPFFPLCFSLLQILFSVIRMLVEQKSHQLVEEVVDVVLAPPLPPISFLLELCPILEQPSNVAQLFGVCTTLVKLGSLVTSTIAELSHLACLAMIVLYLVDYVTNTSHYIASNNSEWKDVIVGKLQQHYYKHMVMSSRLAEMMPLAMAYDSEDTLLIRSFNDTRRSKIVTELR